MPNQPAPCRFYALGHCQKGTSCTFSHSNEQQICQFYLAGKCSYGIKCINKHQKIKGPVKNSSTALKVTSKTTVVPVSLPSSDLCPFKKQYCKWGAKCKATHGDICPVCDLPVLDPRTQNLHKVHIDNCEKISQSISISQQQECVVCYEQVRKEGKGMFGLLQCQHCACYGCISQWRETEKQDGSKTCPICRTITYFVVPSEKWPADKEEKQLIIEDYKRKLSKIDCKHYKKGQGTCPFGTSCFYKHTDKYGVTDKEKTRIISAADFDENGLKVMTTTTLFDYLKL